MSLPTYQNFYPILLRNSSEAKTADEEDLRELENLIKTFLFFQTQLIQMKHNLKNQH